MITPQKIAELRSRAASHRDCSPDPCWQHDLAQDVGALVSAYERLRSLAQRMDEALSNGCDPVQGSNNPLEALRFDIQEALKAPEAGKEAKP